MTAPDDVIARIAASMARTQVEDAHRAARAQAYAGPERRRSRIAAADRVRKAAADPAPERAHVPTEPPP